MGARVDGLQDGEDLVGDKIEVGVSDVVGHAGVVEDSDDAGGVDAADVLPESR